MPLAQQCQVIEMCFSAVSGCEAVVGVAAVRALATPREATVFVTHPKPAPQVFTGPITVNGKNGTGHGMRHHTIPPGFTTGQEASSLHVHRPHTDQLSIRIGAASEGRDRNSDLHVRANRTQGVTVPERGAREGDVSEDIRTDLITTPAEDTTSLGYQQRFAAALPQAIIGRPRNELDIDRLAGLGCCVDFGQRS